MMHCTCGTEAYMQFRKDPETRMLENYWWCFECKKRCDITESYPSVGQQLEIEVRKRISKGIDFVKVDIKIGNVKATTKEVDALNKALTAGQATVFVDDDIKLHKDLLKQTPTKTNGIK